jgi:hypothetical protein
MAKMIARRSFRYGGRRLSPGAEFDVSRAGDVRLLSALGHAKVKPAQPIVKPAVNPAPPKQIKKAEPPPEDAKSEPAEIIESSKDPDEVETQISKKPRRRYKRRDMEAE